ncbi:MAG: c-type cytochrome domain-containing protein [Bdellovibrionales bacterium]
MQIPEETRLISQKVEPTYESLYNLVIEPRCLSCHKPGGRAEDYPITTYDELINGPLESVIIPGNPQASTFFRVVQPGARRPMPPPSLGLRPLSSTEIEVLRQWIQSGAPGPETLDENLLPTDSPFSESDRF